MQAISDILYVDLHENLHALLFQILFKIITTHSILVQTSEVPNVLTYIRKLFSVDQGALGECDPPIL